MPDVDYSSVERSLDDVRNLMAEALSDTVLRQLSADYRGMLGNGKMLRARLAFRVGPAARTPYKTLLHASAAVEMIHAASLLHDDVIDGGMIRRGAPTFWVERGVPGAILVGDLMLFKALDLMCQVEGGRLTHTLVKLTGEVCDAESEQELMLRGSLPNWDNCIRIARRKTGALFAFAAFACGGQDEALSATLLECGYAVGTAYQLADDILDANGDPQKSGKTLGSDQSRLKTTAATVPTGTIDPASYVDELCAGADHALAPWPAVHEAWTSFMSLDMRPALNQNLAPAGH